MDELIFCFYKHQGTDCNVWTRDRSSMKADSYQENTHVFKQAAICFYCTTHNALGLGLHRQPSYNHYVFPFFKWTQRVHWKARPNSI